MKALAIAAACVLAFSSGAPVEAFELKRVDSNPCGTARNLFWPSASAAINTFLLQPSSYQSLANEAVARWNDSVSAFHFNGGSGTFCNLNDGVVTLGFAATLCSGAAFGDAVALTVSRFSISTGALTDADVVFDVNESRFNDPDLFREVAMHELGHVLGLDHSDACGASGEGTLMKAVINVSGTRLLAPQADDIAGANFIYNGTSTGDGTVAASNSCAIAGPAAPRGWWVLLLPLVMALRRRRRCAANARG